jgi:hypothetical protein
VIEVTRNQLMVLVAGGVAGGFLLGVAVSVLVGRVSDWFDDSMSP